MKSLYPNSHWKFNDLIRFDLIKAIDWQKVRNGHSFISSLWQSHELKFIFLSTKDDFFFVFSEKLSNQVQFSRESSVSRDYIVMYRRLVTVTFLTDFPEIHYDKKFMLSVFFRKIKFGLKVWLNIKILRKYSSRTGLGRQWNREYICSFFGTKVYFCFRFVRMAKWWS